MTIKTNNKAYISVEFLEAEFLIKSIDTSSPELFKLSIIHIETQKKLTVKLAAEDLLIDEQLKLVNTILNAEPIHLLICLIKNDDKIIRASIEYIC